LSCARYRNNLTKHVVARSKYEIRICNMTTTTADYCSCRLVKNFGSLLNTQPSTSLEYALRPPTIPINSGLPLSKKEATMPPFTAVWVL
jgi:hypothetical protein